MSAFSKAELSSLFSLKNRQAIHTGPNIASLQQCRHRCAGFIAPLPVLRRAHCAIANIAKASLCRCQYHVVFVAPLPISRRAHCAIANIVEGSLCHCQYCGGFIASLPIEKNNILGLKCSLRCCIQIPNLFQCHCQQLYVVDKRLLTDLCAPLTIRFQIANSRTRLHCNFKGLSLHEGRVDFSKNRRASVFNDDLSNEPPSRWTVPLNGRFLTDK